MKKLFGLLFLALFTIFGLVTLSNAELVVPIRQESLSEKRVYAYRGWQSVGIQVQEDELIHIQAEGEWLYTPGDYHGPNGHSRYSSPSFYPVSNIPGGALIGRIGENGSPFYVGERYTRSGIQTGTLYLRINDDILSDNDGWMAVDISVENIEVN